MNMLHVHQPHYWLQSCSASLKKKNYIAKKLQNDYNFPVLVVQQKTIW